MTNNDHSQSPADAALAKIRAGEVSMRPKAYFLAKAALVLCVALAVTIVSILIASFLIFTLRVTGNDALLSFGPRGIELFLLVFPWPLLLIDLALVALLRFLLARFRFAYRSPLVYFVIALLVVLGTGALALEQGEFHDRRFEEAERGELPGFIERAYEGVYERPPEEFGLYRGIVIEASAGAFVMTSDDFDGDEDDGTWTVRYEDAGARPPEVRVGDRVYVAGEREEWGIEAYGVRVLPAGPRQ